jgi:hypothetical protein
MATRKTTRPVKKAGTTADHSQLKSENSEMKATIARLEATIAGMSEAISNLSGEGIYHKGHKGNHHEGHEVHEGNLSATESHGLNTDGLNYNNSRVSSVKSSENLVPPAQQYANNNLRDLRELRGEKNLRGENETLAPHPSSLDPRVQLGAPMITGVAATANTFTVTWSAVSAAYSYTVQYSKDPSFSSGAQTGIVNAPLTSYTVTGREPESTYYVRVKSYPNLPGDDTASDYSASQMIRTLSLSTETTPPGGWETAADGLQHWYSELLSVTRNFSGGLPQLEETVLDTTDRRRLRASGVRRYGFIGKVFEVAVDYPQFWPAVVNDATKEKFAGLVREVDVLRNLLIWFQFNSRVIQDLLMMAGDDAFRITGMYYTTVRDLARKKVPEAIQVFRMLQLFWHKSRRNSGQPTQKQLGRHAKEVAEGKRDGEFYAKNESDTVTKGKRTVVDKTYPRRRGPKFVEKDYIEEDLEFDSLDSSSGCVEGK